MQKFERAWKLHVAILAPILLLCIAYGAPTNILAFAFVFVPLALPYTIVSTALVAVIGKRWPGVVLAHCLGLAAGVVVLSFFVTVEKPAVHQNPR
jgi:hypothetical protein